MPYFKKLFYLELLGHLGGCLYKFWEKSETKNFLADNGLMHNNLSLTIIFGNRASWVFFYFSSCFISYFCNTMLLCFANICLTIYRLQSFTFIVGCLLPPPTPQRFPVSRAFISLLNKCHEFASTVPWARNENSSSYCGAHRPNNLFTNMLWYSINVSMI